MADEQKPAETVTIDGTAYVIDDLPQDIIDTLTVLTVHNTEATKLQEKLQAAGTILKVFTERLKISLEEYNKK